MKITKDGKGKHIIDFEGLNVSCDTDCAVSELFDVKYVSLVTNGKFFIPNEKIAVSMGSIEIPEQEQEKWMHGKN